MPASNELDTEDAAGEPAAELSAVAEASHAGLRLDVFCTRVFAGLTRTQAQKHIDDDRLLLNGMPGIASTKIKTGDTVTFLPPPPQPMVFFFFARSGRDSPRAAQASSEARNSGEGHAVPAELYSA